MKKNLFAVIGIILIIILNALAFAERYHHEKNVFSVETANQVFDIYSKKLETQHDYNTIAFYVRKIDVVHNDAKKCVALSESHLKTLDGLLKSTQIEGTTPLHRADLQFLRTKQGFYAQQLSDCRLLVYRSNESLDHYKDMMQEMSADQILHRSTPIWKLQENSWRSFVGVIDSDKIVKMSGILQISRVQWTSVAIFLLLFGVIAFYIRTVLRNTIKIVDNMHPLWRSFLKVLSNFIVPCTLFAVLSIFLNSAFQEAVTTPTVSLISHALLVFTLSMAVARYLFYPAADMRGLFSLPSEYGCRFYHRIVFLLCLLFVGYVVSMLLREQGFPLALIELSRTTYLTLMSAITAWVFFLWYRSPYADRFHHGSLAFCCTIFILALVALVFLEWIGFHRLAIFALSGLCLTAVFTILALAAWRLIDVLYQWIDNGHYHSARKIHQFFGVKHSKKMHEISLIKLAAYFSVLCLYAVMMMHSWSISPIFVDSMIDGLFFGFKFFSVTIVPSRLILACLVFAIVFLIGRLVAASIASKQQFKNEENAQIAVATITIYISFAVALLFSLFVSGVDFTGLAIIAGALSVGIGLGLQNIVNNFVSGLIILLEKPIRPGDRIVIGKTEGIVRKIRIRSTQIATLSKEDVIVPNADFMTQQVTNYMFRDRYSRVSCQVGVAYGSDVHLVKKVLLEVSANHAEVVQEAPNTPVVLFSRFGESSLIFDLLCVIYDVNRKYMVVSDLNFAIDAAFRLHKIDIAFPQREIRIKQ
jgi:potassium efflux system protein